MSSGKPRSIKAVIVVPMSHEEIKKGKYKVLFLHDLALFKPAPWSDSRVVELVHTMEYGDWVVKRPSTNTEFARVRHNDLEFLNRKYFKAVVSVDNNSRVVVY